MSSWVTSMTSGKLKSEQTKLSPLADSQLHLFKPQESDLDSDALLMESSKSETTGQQPTKKCDTCREWLLLDCFYNNKYKHDGLSSTCKECHQGNALRKRQHYHRLVNQQEGKCLICGITTEENGKDFAVDHCHKSGNIRGALCNNCNTGIGNFQDNTELLAKAIEYLKEFNNENN